jgi:Tol biopolymer transport system component
MNLPRMTSKRLGVLVAVVVAASAAIALGVADSASPPEAGPKVDTHVDNNGLFVIDVATRQLTQPTHHEDAKEPSWSATGQIAFSAMTCDECESAVSEVDPEGTTQVQIDANVTHLFQPSWAPDGRKLAVVALGRGIYSLDSQAQTAKRLTSGVSDEAPAWSPAGDLIAFHKHVRGTNYDLFAVNPVTGKLRRLTNDAEQQTNPTWSPDGSRIAFSQQQANGKWAIYTMHLDGTSKRRVTGTGTSAQEPAWSPDGKKIAFILQELDRATLAIVDAGGGTPERLTDESLFPSRPTWSPDSTSIAFSALETAAP